MAHNIYEVPSTIPAPEDDHACDHLAGLSIPSTPLSTTHETTVDLASIGGRCVVFVYPRTGRPGALPLVSEWNQIPGARGCTPQTCGFRDLHAEFRAAGVQVYGLSTQETAYQRELSERLGLPFPILSDVDLKLVSALRLPTFEVAGQTLIKRMAWYAEDGVITHVFYPVFPPDQNATNVLAWLRER